MAARLFPTRTLVLMVLALFAFGWMYWQTHLGQPRAPAQKAELRPGVEVIALPSDAGREEIERAFAAALARTPDGGNGGDL